MDHQHRPSIYAGDILKIAFESPSHDQIIAWEGIFLPWKFIVDGYDVLAADLQCRCFPGREFYYALFPGNHAGYADVAVVIADNETSVGHALSQKRNKYQGNHKREDSAIKQTFFSFHP